MTGETESGFLTIPGAEGLTGPISASFDYNEVEFSVTKGDFKVGGIQYTQFGEAEDVLMAFSYTASDADGDVVSGSFSVTVTDNHGSTTGLAGAGDLATITSTGPDHVIV